MLKPAKFIYNRYMGYIDKLAKIKKFQTPYFMKVYSLGTLKLFLRDSDVEEN